MQAVILISLSAGLLFFIIMNITNLIHDYWKVDEDKICRRCNGIGLPSKGFEDTYLESMDFHDSKPGDRGNTMSKSGPPVLLDCLKCSDCGHSWIPKS